VPEIRSGALGHAPTAHMSNRTDAPEPAYVALSAADLRDLRRIIDASLDSHPSIRHVSRDDTRMLSSHLSVLLSSAGQQESVRLCTKHVRDLADIVLSVCVEGASWFPSLVDHDITDDRVTELCDLIWNTLDW
jgi:hypothetical protein